MFKKKNTRKMHKIQWDNQQTYDFKTRKLHPTVFSVDDSRIAIPSFDKDYHLCP